MSFEITYAPKTIAEYVMPSQQVKSTVDAYMAGRALKPLILHGPYGTGKSSLAKLLPSAIEGFPAQIDVAKAHEFASINDVRDLFAAPMLYYKHFSINDQKRQYFITNELSCSPKAAVAFRDVLDLLQTDVQFIFTTNCLDTIDGGIRDRSTCLYVGNASAEAWLPRAQYILAAESVSIPSAELLQMLRAQLQISASNRQVLSKLEELVAMAKAGPQETPPPSPPIVQNPPPIAPQFNPLGIATAA